MRSRSDDEIIFQHLVDMPDFSCVFCATRGNRTGRTQLYLIFQDRQRIYRRNGVNSTWDELKDEQQYQQVHDGFEEALRERKIPCFSSRNRIQAYVPGIDQLLHDTE